LSTAEPTAHTYRGLSGCCRWAPYHIKEEYFDPYDAEIHRNPYPTYQRLRDEAPLYYNERHDFYAVSRYDDVERGLADRQTFISGRGNVLEFIKSGAQMPPGIPEADQVAIRDKSNANMRTKAGKGMRINQQNLMLGGNSPRTSTGAPRIRPTTS